MKSSLIEEAAAVESGGMRHPAGGKAVDVENWINSDSIAVGVTKHSLRTFDTDDEQSLQDADEGLVLLIFL